MKIGAMNHIVTRVYLPPFDEWEKRSGSQLGFRADAQAYANLSSRNGEFAPGRRQLNHP